MNMHENSGIGTLEIESVEVVAIPSFVILSGIDLKQTS